MGLWSWLIDGHYGPSPAAIVSPLAPQDSLETAIVGDFFGELPAETINAETARRVPEMKRALAAHQALVAPLRFEKYAGDQRAQFQPYWVSQCGYAGMSRYIAVKTLVSELFWHGFAVLGCQLATDGTVYDWITIPRGFWVQDRQTGRVTIDERIPAVYRMRTVLVPLGENGVMADGIDSIRQARKLEAARQARLDSPPAATELHITDARFDEMTEKEKSKLAAGYSQNRTKYSVAVTPSYLDVKERGISGQLDLFESAKNSLRLELAMHGGVPASFVEGGREGGSGGEMTYQNENGQPSEIWQFGSATYAYAIAAALSGDDVVGADAEVRFDTTAIRTPAPGVYDPEAGDDPATDTAAEEAQA